VLYILVFIYHYQNKNQGHKMRHLKNAEEKKLIFIFKKNNNNKKSFIFVLH
jgi:hypothetical protein